MDDDDDDDDDGIGAAWFACWEPYREGVKLTGEIFHSLILSTTQKQITKKLESQKFVKILKKKDEGKREMDVGEMRLNE